ncbi:MAG: porphobilinogen synthase [Saprospiraceae bacterium]|nr:porphobilinogen synthase [Saprospiraceae bacterium]
MRRPRRNRRTQGIRSLVKETRLSPDQLVYPLFLVDGEGIREEVSSLPGNYRLSVDKAIATIESSLERGLSKFILFPSVSDEHKDKRASYSFDPGNFYLQAARTFKRRFPNTVLISDAALDPYSSDGHDGLVKDGEILNDETLPILAKMAVEQARAGFDIIGPSDMMDGRVGTIRAALDHSGFTNTGIMSYTAKYASAFYGPFRDALDSAPKTGDKKTYQMDPANRREALIEADLDIGEGADFLMVKPAVHYLDVILSLREYTDLPIAAYHVSGECAMLHAAARNGWLDLESAVEETLLAIRRAGADVIITYFARDLAERMV